MPCKIGLAGSSSSLESSEELSSSTGLVATLAVLFCALVKYSEIKLY